MPPATAAGRPARRAGRRHALRHHAHLQHRGPAVLRGGRRRGGVSAGGQDLPRGGRAGGGWGRAGGRGCVCQSGCMEGVARGCSFLAGQRTVDPAARREPPRVCPHVSCLPVSSAVHHAQQAWRITESVHAALQFIIFSLPANTRCCWSAVQVVNLYLHLGTPPSSNTELGRFPPLTLYFYPRLPPCSAWTTSSLHAPTAAATPSSTSRCGC
jgi:hypothetical protein